MRSLMFSCILGLAVASNVLINETEYNHIPGRQYLYAYTSQVSTGLVVNDRQQSGFKLTTSAVMQFRGTKEVRVTFTDVLLYKIDQPIVQTETQTASNVNTMLKEWVSADAFDTIKALKIPFSFTYIDGHIVVVSFDESDPTVDIKKGFMSLFEVNLEKRMLLEDTVSTPDLTSQYTVVESTPTGDCATRYMVTKADTTPNAFRTVLKMRDYERCLDAPVFVQSPFFEGEDMADRLKASPLTRVGSVDYTIREETDPKMILKFIIISAVAEETIVFSPYHDPKEMEEVRTTVNQTLTLLRSSQIPRDAKIAPVAAHPAHTAQHLRMSLPSAHVAQDPFTLSPLTPTSALPVYSARAILHQLYELSKNVHGLTSREGLVHLRLITDMLRTAPVATIKDVYTQLKDVNKDIDTVALDTMWKALPHVATEAAVNFTLEICSTDAGMEAKCAVSLAVMGTTCTPTPAIITKVIEMINKNTTPLSDLMKQKLYLTLGTFGYKVTNSKNKVLKQMDIAESMLNTLQRDNQKTIRQMVQLKKTEVKERRTTVETVHTEISSLITNVLKTLLESPIEEDKVLALKAIGNAGLRETIPLLRTVLMTNTTSDQVLLKTLAVYAHRRMHTTTESQKAAKTLLVGIFMNTNETHEVRTAAFTILMSLRPSLALMEKLVATMNHERDLFVSSYVLSFMQAFANSTFEPVWPLSKNASKALTSAPLYTTGTEHSFYTFAGRYSEKLRMGASIDLASIGSMDRYFGVASSLSSTILGTKTTPIEIGMNSMNLNTFLTKIMGGETRTPQEFISKIIDELKISTRAMKAPKGHVYVKCFGHEISYFDFPKFAMALMSMATTSGLSMPMSLLPTGSLPVDWTTAMYIADVKQSLPTEAGLPLTLQAQLTATVNVKGTIGFGAQPIKMTVDLNKKFVTGMYASMGLDMFLVKPTVGFHALIKIDTPMDTEVTYDMDTNKLEMKNTLKHTLDTPVVQVIVEPFHEYLILSNTSNTNTMEYSVTPIVAAAGQRTQPIAWTLPLTPLGWKVEVEGQTTLEPMIPFMTTGMNFFVKPINEKSFPKTITTVVKFMTGRTQSQKTETADESAWFSWTPTQTDTITPTSKDYTIMTLTKNLMNVLNRPVPTTVSRDAFAIALTVDATPEDASTPRTMSMELLFNYKNKDLTQERIMRFWRSEIKDVYDESWQFVTDFTMTNPEKSFEPEDALTVEWNQELLEELKWHLQMDSSKVVNQLLNMTATGQAHPMMKHVSVFKVMDGLIPEHLLSLKKSLTTDSIDWAQYWTTLYPIYTKVESERMMVVDHYMTPLGRHISELTYQLTKVQIKLLTDLKTITESGKVMEAELPVIQWLIQAQATTVTTLYEVAIKMNAKVPESRNGPGSGVWMNSLDIVKQFETVLTNTTIMSVATKPVLANTHNALRQEEEEEFNTHTNKDDMIKVLKTLVLKQITEIKAIQTALPVENTVNPTKLMTLIKDTRATITTFDSYWTGTAILDPRVVHNLMLVTINNEFLIEMWQNYFKYRTMMVFYGAMTAVDSETRKLEIECDEQLKWVSFDLADRVAHSYKTNKVNAIIEEIFPTEEIQMYNLVISTIKDCTVSQRSFMMEIRNTTTLKNPETVKAIMQDMRVTIGVVFARLNLVIESMATLPRQPSLYLVSELHEAIVVLRDFTEMTRDSLMAITHDDKLTWIQTLDKWSTKIQTLVRDMSPIFEMYTVPVEADTPTFTPTSINGTLNILWGKDLTNTFNIEMMAVKSVEQILWQFHQLDSMSRSQEMVNGINRKLSGEVMDKLSVRDTFNTYNHIHLTATTQTMPVWVREWATTVQETLKFNLWNFYSRQTTVATLTATAPMTTHAIIDVSEVNNKVDMTVLTPTETDMFVNVPLSPWFKTFKPTQTVRPIVQQWIETVSGGFAPAVCTVNNNTVQTFDLFSYSFPSIIHHTTCKTVLAIDCSPEQSFVVTRVPATNVVEIAFGDEFITLTPTTNPELNNKKITLVNGQTIVLPTLVMTRVDAVTKVTLTQLGVTVTMEGTTITIKVSPLFKHRMCGMCSNFDGQRSWEMEYPSKALAPSDTLFTLSYTLQSTCPSDTQRALINAWTAALNNTYTKSDTIQEVTEEKFDGCKTEMVTKVKIMKRKQMACFSTPISMCSFDCEDYVDHSEKVAYHCFNLKKESTRSMLKGVQQGNVLDIDTFKGVIVTKSKKEFIQTNCQ